MCKFIKDKIDDIREKRHRKKQIYPALNDFGRRIEALEKKVEELSKRTISQKTTQDDPVPFSQIVDEWLNGAEEEGNGD